MFDETQHPRSAAGTFTDKPQSAPDIVLDAGPRPQEPGEVIVWLIEGDDHEFERVEAVTEAEAINTAAERFEERYVDHGDEEDDAFRGEDLRDSLVIAGTFRGDIDGYSDEFEFVPYGDLDEKTAMRKLAASA